MRKAEDTSRDNNFGQIRFQSRLTPEVECPYKDDDNTIGR